MKIVQGYTSIELQNIGIQDLREIYRKLGGTPSLRGKDELIECILSAQAGKKPIKGSTRGRKPLSEKNNEYTKDVFSETYVSDNSEDDSKNKEVQGLLEICADGYGFLRGENYEIDGSSDIYVSKQTIKACKLRRGDYIVGVAEKTTSSPSLIEINSLNGEVFNGVVSRKYFDDLTPCYPDEKIYLEVNGESDDLSIRAVDILCPIGKGQRGLIVAPPKAGKTTLLKKIAHSIERNHKDMHLIILLIDERPEEVTDIKRSVKGEVIYSTFDETAEHHTRASENVLNRAKRLVENGKDVIILLDSITKLARAYNTVMPSSGKTLTGGIDPTALQLPKKFFGSARNVEEGGSLTILATALIETGSKMDEVIFEEFKGTGNMEIILTRELAEKRIFPAIDLFRSGTRKEELLLTKKELDCSYAVRRYFAKMDNASESLLDMLNKTASNSEFVEKAPTWCELFKK